MHVYIIHMHKCIFIFPCILSPFLQQSFSGDLMIRNIQLNHGGKYVCLIDTDVESLSADAILVVKGRNKLSFGLYVHMRNICLPSPALYLSIAVLRTSVPLGVYFNERGRLM